VALTIQDPQKAFEASKKYVENLSDDRMEVLMTSIELYASPYTREKGLGFTNPEGWQKALELLTSVGRVTTDSPVETFYSNDYLTPGIGAE
jgi:NitT/TauT family transport system substrate-binding protein